METRYEKGNTYKDTKNQGGKKVKEDIGGKRGKRERSEKKK